MISKLISFKQIPFTNYNNIKVASVYRMPMANDSDVFVSIDNDYEENKFITKIDDGFYNNLATNKFIINKEDNVLENGGMDVWSTRQRNNGFGVVMHLNNIMSLIENDLEKITLDSLGQAVLFHAKCKFEPDMKNFDDIENALYNVSTKDTSSFPEISNAVKKAGEYFDEIYITGGVDALNKDKRKYANSIVNEYLEIVSKKKLTPEQKEIYGFGCGFPMVLTKERILENKDFFNGLFEKFGIDYKIKDPQ